MTRLSPHGPKVATCLRRQFSDWGQRANQTNSSDGGFITKAPISPQGITQLAGGGFA